MARKRNLNPREDLPIELLEEYREAFQEFVEGSVEEDQIDIEKLGEIMRGLNQDPTEAELKDMIREVDENCDGEIDLDEFLILMSSKTIDQEEEYREAFKLFDVEDKGIITTADLQTVFRRIGHSLSVEECAQMVDEVSGQSGATGIVFPDFVELMRRNISVRSDFFAEIS